MCDTPLARASQRARIPFDGISRPSLIDSVLAVFALVSGWMPGGRRSRDWVVGGRRLLGLLLWLRTVPRDPV